MGIKRTLDLSHDQNAALDSFIEKRGKEDRFLLLAHILVPTPTSLPFFQSFLASGTDEASP